MQALKQAGAAVAAQAYGFITTTRNRLYDSGYLHSFTVPLQTISVGNITAGGNGKTPLCIFLAREFLEHGRKPVLLSRGYGGTLKGPIVVEEQHSSREVGDEPLLLKLRTGCPVVIARDRVAGAKFIAEHELGDLIILDDAFQHRRMRRTVDIVCVDVSTEQSIREFSEGRLLPFGRFREHREAALKRADVVILMKRAVAGTALPPDHAVRELLPAHLKIAEAHLEAGKIAEIENGQELSPCKVIALCGIANPQGFFRSLETLGFSLVKTVSFRDHYEYCASDLEKVQAEYPGIPLVCTEKDAIKLRGMSLSGVYSFSVSVQVLEAEQLFEYLVGNTGKKTS